MADAVAHPETRLVLIRHGHARASADHIVAGHGECPGLTELGFRQARALHDRLAKSGEVRADALFTSVLTRAIETAEIVAPAVASSDAERDCDFCELHVGEANGMSYDQYQATYGSFDMRTNPERPLSPGGESLVTFQRRVDARLEKLIGEHAGQTVVVVCHGGVISAITQALTGNAMHRTPFRVQPANTSITEWVRPVDDDERWVLQRYNDASHIEGLA